jgi:hypothetical protein
LLIVVYYPDPPPPTPEKLALLAAYTEQPSNKPHTTIADTPPD